MKKLFVRVVTSKPFVAASAACASVVAFAAEGDGATGVTSALVTPYITEGKTQIVAVLTAGAVIMGAFFVWGLIKRALNRSK